MIDATPFDISRQPKIGLTVLEASAGTGKTFSIAGMTVLALARGTVTTRDICVVTFTEMATSELSGRLRSRLVTAIELLQKADVSEREELNDVDRALLDVGGGGESERSERIGRLALALTEFDAMTISTIHGFCQRLLASVGSSTGISMHQRDVEEAVHDVMLRNQVFPAKPDRVIAATKLRLSVPDAQLAEFPSAKPDVIDDINQVVGLVEEAVDEVKQRRTKWRRRTFDSMLTETRDLLVDESLGAATVAELRRRFRFVLVDEFQDTDLVQWEIFRTAFLDETRGENTTAMVVVGDPKQSIYRFRGAELSAYLTAVDYARNSGGDIHTLDTNYRSDALLLEGLDAIFAGATFGDDEVRFESVKPGRLGDGKHVVGPSGDHLPPCQFRVIRPPTNDKGAVEAPLARSWIVSDVVNEVIHYLSDVMLVRDTGAEATALRPADIAIVVRSNNDARLLANALRSAGVPASTSGTDPVLDSPAAGHWEALVQALLLPSSVGLARVVALGPFGDADIQALDNFEANDDANLIEWQRTLIRSMRAGGVSALMSALHEHGCASRVLGNLDGERLLTDIEHIGELLHQATGGRPCTPTDLAMGFADLRSLSDDSSTRDILDRRLDRDDDTVTVMTIHKAKGLEFPIVMCPLLWNSKNSNSKSAPHAVAPDSGTRLIDSYWVTGGTSTAKAVKTVRDLAKEEEAGEHQRDLYVALTRAAHRLVLWTVPDHTWGTQPLRILLEGSCGLAPVEAAKANPLAIEVIAVTDRPNRKSIAASQPSSSVLAVHSTDRTFDDHWRIWSFTSIDRSLRTGNADPLIRYQFDPVLGGVDEQQGVEAPHSEPSAQQDLRNIPGSAAFGTLVHEVLEHVDFTSPTIEADLISELEDRMQQRGLEIPAPAIAGGLAGALRCELGGPLGDVRLADLNRHDRRDELEFLLPLPSVSTRDLAQRVSEALDDHDPLKPWFVTVAEGELSIEIEGMLTGSIDLVARRDGRYFVADYKTNRIADDATFSIAEMATEMVHHGYPLQALLYLVALRRFLRLRSPAGNVDDSIIGAAYLFVRGMVAETDSTSGVMWWTPPMSLIADIDTNLFGGDY